MARAIKLPIGKPFSERSIACSSTFSKLIVPQRSNKMNQASTIPGTVRKQAVALRQLAAIVLLIPFDRRQPWRCAFSIERYHFFRPRIVNQNHRVAADSVHRGVHHAEYGLPSHYRIERVAARLEDSFRRACGFSLHRRNRVMSSTYYWTHG